MSSKIKSVLRWVVDFFIIFTTVFVLKKFDVSNKVLFIVAGVLLSAIVILGIVIFILDRSEKNAE